MSSLKRPDSGGREVEPLLSDSENPEIHGLVESVEAFYVVRLDLRRKLINAAGKFFDGVIRPMTFDGAVRSRGGCCDV